MRGARLVAALCLAAFAAQIGWGLWADSSVADEHPHILSGWLYATSGRFSGGADNPPLGQLLVAAPLVRLPYAYPADDYLALARLPVALVALGLAWLLGGWGRALAGERGRLLVLAGLALEPNLLAHAHLATLDLPLVAAWWAALAAWRRYLVREEQGAPPASRVRAAALFALAAAAATHTKFTGLLLYPAAWLVAILVLPRRRAAATLAVAGALVVAYVTAPAVYGFEPLRAGLPEHLVSGLQGKQVHRGEVHFAYLAGRRSDSGFLQYYIVALLVKTPLPLLLLSALGAASAWRRRPDAALLLVPAALVVVAFTLARVHIGVRHVLAVYPALVLLSALGALRAWSAGRAGRAGVLLLTALWLAGVARTAPQYLAYFNILAGGPAGGHRWLLDSNLDWGQDDARLERFLATSDAAWQVNPAPQPARPGRFAVSANALYNLQRRDDTPYDWLRAFAASAHAGASWHLYDLEPRDFAARAAAPEAGPLALVAHAEVLSGSGDAAGAESVWATAAGRFPSDARIWTRAALAARRQGDAGRAARWAARGLRAVPEDAGLQILAHGLRLEAAYRAAPGTGRERARAALDLGLWLGDLGEVDSAVVFLAEAAAGLPGDVDAQRAHGIALAQQGDFESAARILSQPPAAAELAEERDMCARLARTQRALRFGAVGSRDDLFELGVVHFDRGRYDAAAEALVALLRRWPEDGRAVAYLGEMQVRAKQRIVSERLRPRPMGRVRPSSPP